MDANQKFQEMMLSRGKSNWNRALNVVTSAAFLQQSVAETKRKRKIETGSYSEPQVRPRRCKCDNGTRPAKLLHFKSKTGDVCWRMGCSKIKKGCDFLVKATIEVPLAQSASDSTSKKLKGDDHRLFSTDPPEVTQFPPKTDSNIHVARTNYRPWPISYSSQSPPLSPNRQSVRITATTTTTTATTSNQLLPTTIRSSPKKVTARTVRPRPPSQPRAVDDYAFWSSLDTLTDNLALEYGVKSRTNSRKQENQIESMSSNCTISLIPTTPKTITSSSSSSTPKSSNPIVSTSNVDDTAIGDTVVGDTVVDDTVGTVYTFEPSEHSLSSSDSVELIARPPSSPLRNVQSIHHVNNNRSKSKTKPSSPTMVLNTTTTATVTTTKKKRVMVTTTMNHSHGNAKVNNTTTTTTATNATPVNMNMDTKSANRVDEDTKNVDDDTNNVDADTDRQAIESEHAAQSRFNHHASRRKFACMRSAPLVNGQEDTKARHARVPDENRNVVHWLGKIVEDYEAKSVGNNVYNFKSKNMKDVIRSINNMTRPLSAMTREEIRQIRNCGKKTAEKIEEILQTGSSERALFRSNDTIEMTKTLFAKVWGIGDKTAAALASQGFRTIDELRADLDIFNNFSGMTKIGLEFFDDILLRIPREEVAVHANFIVDTAHRLVGDPSLVEVTLCGSYRRGKSTSGDIDMMVVHKDDKKLYSFFAKLVVELKRVGYITHDPTSAAGFHCSKAEKFMGLCKLEGGQHDRRLDIIAVLNEHRACSLLYFTGNAYLNRSMRSLCHRQNKSLSQHYLKENVVRDAHGKTICEGDIVAGITEEIHIFQHLGLPYIEPTNRNHA